MEFDEDLMIPDKRLSIAEGAIQVMGWQSCTDPSSFTYAILKALTEEYHFSLETPYCEYPEEIRHVLIYGTDGREVKVHYRGQRGEGVYDVAFEGLIKNVQRKYRETGSEVMKQEYEQFMRITPCETCKGQRLKAESLAVTVADKNIYEMTSMSVKKLNTFLAEMKLGEQQHRIGDQILKEIRARVGFLNEVGLDYLSLSRATGTLSGGEAQRIRLATQIGSGLVGVAYILDEPSIGLHQRDNDKAAGGAEEFKRSRQHTDCRGARRGYDACRGLYCGYRTGSRLTRWRSGRLRYGTGDHEESEVDHGSVLKWQNQDPGTG